MESVASKALARELVNSGVPKTQFLQNKWPYFIKCSTSGVRRKSTTHSFIHLLLWKGILLLTINRWIVVFQVFSLLGEIALPLKLPSGVLRSYFNSLSVILCWADGGLPGGLSNVQLERPVQEQKPPTNSLEQKMPENCPLLWSWEERDMGAISVSGGVSVGVVWRIKVWFPNPRDQGPGQPQYWMLSCLLQGTVSPQPPFMDCSSASISGFNITVFMK